MKTELSLCAISLLKQFKISIQIKIKGFWVHLLALRKIVANLGIMGLIYYVNRYLTKKDEYYLKILHLQYIILVLSSKMRLFIMRG